MKLVVTLILSTLLVTSHAFGITALGSGYTCDGTKILDTRGKSVKFAKVKEKLDPKIATIKTKIATAKKQGKTAKVTSLSASLATVKTSLSSAKKCTKGTLLPAVSPLWNTIAGAFNGSYNLFLSPNTPIGDGTMQVVNTFDGTTAAVSITFLSGPAQIVIPAATVIQFTAVGAVFPITQTVTGTPIGNLNVTLLETGEIAITSVLSQGLFAGMDLSFNGTFGAATIPGSFVVSYQGQAFAQGDFLVSK